MKSKLSPYELNTLLPRMLKGFSVRVGEHHAIKSTEIITVLKAEGYKITDAQIRTIVRYVRQHHLLPRLASSAASGYWIENDPNKLRICIARLRSRAQEALLSADALAQDYVKLTQTTAVPS